jgi:LDH2 family malate/lactate/ureidoglycolate dehydrogenase
VLTVGDLVVTVGAREQEHVILRGADLSVADGECLLIIGPTGSGKSVIASVLTGRTRPRFGTVRPLARLAWAEHARSDRPEANHDGVLLSALVLVVDDADQWPTTGLQSVLVERRRQGLTTVLLARSRGELPADLVVRLARGLLIADPPAGLTADPAIDAAVGAGEPAGTSTAAAGIPVAQLHRLTRSTLLDAGVSRSDAELVAQVLVDADVRGHHSHGVALLPTYLGRLRAGGIDPAAPVTLVDDGSVAQVDAAGGFGQVGAMMAARWCAERAVATGLAVASVRNNNHVGMMAAYRHPFQQAGVVGLGLNISGPSLAPPGAPRPALGSSAVCLIVPTEQPEPFVIDFGTGTVSLGKIRTAGSSGAAIPSGWLQDASGNPTTDPDELDRGGSVPIFGGYKGLCVTLIVEVLAGMVAAGTISPRVAKQRQQPHRPMNCSQLFLGLAPRAFGQRSLGPLVDELADRVREAYPQTPPEPWFPDQMETGNACAAARSGIRLPDTLIHELGWA